MKAFVTVSALTFQLYFTKYIGHYDIKTLDTTFVDGSDTEVDCPTPDTLPSYQPGPYCPSFTYDPGYTNGNASASPFPDPTKILRF